MSEVLQTQCWICPHCYNDERHQSDANGCEWQDKPLSVVVLSCSACPFVRTRKDYCLANTYLGLQGQDFSVNSSFYHGTLHPKCPLRSKSILISLGDK